MREPNNRGKRKKGGGARFEGGFAALPHIVLDSPAYHRLSHPGRGLLVELARQYNGSNNGALLTSDTYMRTRGWRSTDVVTRARRELTEAGFVFEMVKGARPNRASWFALSWLALDKLTGFDVGAERLFTRNAFMANPSFKPSQSREALFRKWRKDEEHGAPLTPSHGVKGDPIAPADGVSKEPPTPPDGAIRALSGGSPTPPDGDLLRNMPCTYAERPRLSQHCLHSKVSTRLFRWASANDDTNNHTAHLIGAATTH